ncbi:GTP 3',8-cyclase MoaA [Robiginitalea sp. SC105]|uniref:GTP 3',8-cyclase MoaA n=1 Tax=Robiginitalea sp. SC105 TaxID=2762332 RepID=UPI00163AFF87|nr:GTP 3',8-cyclase MoaA [Robiginitalea sp. SC105]MBC2840564.1 GTP 3',8-cyclase MoaA [Robiginitalea sp. SC105]
MLIDNHNRVINYVRLAVTDRCNLRCNYCMPESGIAFARRSDLLSIPEMQRLCTVLAELGVDKIRITGGEPFVRKGVMKLFGHLSELDSLREISVTSNATLIGPHIGEMQRMGIKCVNISLDAIQPETFAKITRRDEFDKVYGNLMKLIASGIEVRINCVVLGEQNISEIYPMMEFQEKYPVRVRFLEEMPFNGGSRDFKGLEWNHKKILGHIRERYPDFEKVPAPMTATSVNYRIPGHAGSFGIIPAFSRTFCGSCNRLRITATGDLITCLYGKPVANIREPLRQGASTLEMRGILEEILGQRSKDGFEAQERFGPVTGSSMTSIGG